MAKLTEKRAQPEPPPVIGYTLELTVEEAAVLRYVLGSSMIAGPSGSSYSAQKLYDIFHAMASVPLNFKYAADFVRLLQCK